MEIEGFNYSYLILVWVVPNHENILFITLTYIQMLVTFYELAQPIKIIAILNDLGSPREGKWWKMKTKCQVKLTGLDGLMGNGD